MAEDTAPARKRSAAKRKPAAAPAEDRTTKRMVLARAEAIIIPEGIDPEKLKEALRLIGGRSVPKTVWWEVGEFEGSSKQNALEAYAGKPNTPEAKPGAYKAPGASAWAGGRLYEKPPEPKVEVRDLD